MTPSRVEPSCAAHLAGDEIEGQGSPRTELWGLLFSPYPVPRAEQVKIVWRMTGSGELTLLASGPRAEQIGPAWGPEPHSGSNGDKPGTEWGSGFVFPSPGCWTIYGKRGDDTAEVILRVSS